MNSSGSGNFAYPITYGSSITIWNENFQRFLCAEQNGMLVCNRQQALQWETFVVEKASPLDKKPYSNTQEQRYFSLGQVVNFGDLIHLRSYHGNYIVGDDKGRALCDRSTALFWETFKIESPINQKGPVMHGNVVNFLNVHHQQYIVVERDYSVKCNRREAREFEKFSVRLISQHSKPQLQYPYTSQPSYAQPYRQFHTNMPTTYYPPQQSSNPQSSYAPIQPLYPPLSQYTASQQSIYPSQPLPIPQYPSNNVPHTISTNQSSSPPYNLFQTSSLMQSSQPWQAPQPIVQHPPIQQPSLSPPVLNGPIYSLPPSDKVDTILSTLKRTERFEALLEQIKNDVGQQNKVDRLKKYFDDNNGIKLEFTDVLKLLNELSLGNHKIEVLKSIIQNGKCAIQITEAHNIFSLLHQDSEKLKALKIIIEQKHGQLGQITCADACTTILKSFGMESNRFEALKLVMPLLSDFDRTLMIDQFHFSNYKEKAKQVVK